MKVPIPFLFLLLLSSCLKRNEAHVNVACTDSCMTIDVRITTGLNAAAAVSNASLELGWSKPAVPLGNPGRLIATAKSSADGRAHFSFRAKPAELQGGNFYITVKKATDYFGQIAYYSAVRKYDTSINSTIHVPSIASLTIVFKNFNPSGPGDYFQCTPTFSTYGSNPLPLEMKKNGGQASNTFFSATDAAFSELSLTGQTAGDQYTYFSILRKKNGVRTDHLDSVFIPKGQSRVYEVSY